MLPICQCQHGLSQRALQLISGEAVDDFGNSASTSVTINLNKTVPQMSTTQLPIVNLFGCNNSDVTLAFTCSDTGTGIAT